MKSRGFCPEESLTPSWRIGTHPGLGVGPPIPNLEAALEEIRRVLKPGGSLHFVEHGHAPDAKVARWQERIEPINKKLAGGCHLTRRIPQLIEQTGGFKIEHLDSFYFKGEPKPFGYTYEGRATKF